MEHNLRSQHKLVSYHTSHHQEYTWPLRTQHKLVSYHAQNNTSSSITLTKLVELHGIDRVNECTTKRDAEGNPTRVRLMNTHTSLHPALYPSYVKAFVITNQRNFFNVTALLSDPHPGPNSKSNRYIDVVLTYVDANELIGRL